MTMVRSQSLLETSDEAQDSQAVFEALQAELGCATGFDGGASLGALVPGSTCVSAHGGAIANENTAQNASISSANQQIVLESSAVASRSVAADVYEQTSTTNQVADTVDDPTHTATAACAESSDCHRRVDEANRRLDRLQINAIQQATAHDGTRRQVKRSQTAAGARKMEASQQTPTQVNEDRDYNDIDTSASLPSTVHDQATQNQNEEPTLHDGETGAVNFAAPISELGRPSSQVSEDGGFESTRGQWRLPDNTSQQIPNALFTPFKPQGMTFETPAMPKNPFGARTSVGAPMGGTQMFGQTQFSSAIKKLSPTSSRPSPNIMLDSISPNIAETSPLKNRANVSSPSDLRTSSPAKPMDEPETAMRDRALERIEEETPLNSRSTRDDIEVPESPTHQQSRLPGSFQPLAQYESIKKSQERKGHEETGIEFEDDSNSDDDARRRERRKKAEKQRAKAALELNAVVFKPVPRRLSSERSSKRRRLTDDSEVPAETTNEIRAMISDSQQRSASSNQVLADQTTQGTDAADAPHDVTIDEVAADDQVAIIPATSPALSTPPEVEPQSELDLPLISDAAPTTAEGGDVGTSSLPLVGRRPRVIRPRRAIISSSTEAASKGCVVESSPPGRVAERFSVQQDISTSKSHAGREPPARITRMTKSRDAGDKDNRDERLSTPVTVGIGDRAPTSSSITSLTSNAPSSSLTTPATHHSVNLDRPHPSPTGHRNLRRQTRQPGKSTSPPSVARSTRMSTRSHYTELESADERQISPREGVDKSVVLPKASSLLRQSTKQAKLGGQLFQNMVFVVSFLPKKQSKQSRQQERIKLETRITEAGGTILSDGFDFLFEESPIMGLTGPTFDKQSTLTILPQHMGAGFTALIADSHSRTPKYMQALALGLPCLAHQWVDRCLDKAAIVDWEPYALCAGASPLLGNALHSRNLAGFDATEAQLAAIIEKRRRLLDGQRVLAVMGQKKGRGEAKQHHLFLAQALGPVISRVFSEEQAKEALAANVKAGTPFDWVYVDAATGTANSVLGSTEADGKKRKRKRGVSAPAPAAGQTRALYDELIIQSLILGRMLDQDEATFLE